MNLGDMRGKRCRQWEALATGAKGKERGNGAQEDIWMSVGHHMVINRHSGNLMRSLEWNEEKAPMCRVTAPWSWWREWRDESACRCTSHPSRIVRNESFLFLTIQEGWEETELKAKRRPGRLEGFLPYWRVLHKQGFISARRSQANGICLRQAEGLPT